MSWQLQLTGLIAERLGITIRLEERGAVLERFVQTRVRALSLLGPEHYVASLQLRADDDPEFVELIAAVANGKTLFFRDLPLLEALVRELRSRRGPVRVWSAGCSTGEEAHSLAALCHRFEVSARITASDVNPRSLAVAHAGRYPGWTMRAVPPHYLGYFTEIEPGQFVVADAARELIELERHNLVADPPLRPAGAAGWDAILCCNVLIYYPVSTIEQVVRDFLATLAPGGLLVLGASESLRGLDVPAELVKLEDRFAYRRRETEREATSARAGSKRASLPPSLPPPPRAGAPASRAGAGSDRGWSLIDQLLGDAQLGPAKAQLERHLTRCPEDAVAWLTLGNVALREHDFTRALELYARAHELAPLMAEVSYLTGLVLRKLGELQRAEHALRRALFLEPRFWPAALLLGGILLRTARKVEARRLLREGLARSEHERLPELFRSRTAGIEPDYLLDPDHRAFARRLA